MLNTTSAAEVALKGICSAGSPENDSARAGFLCLAVKDGFEASKLSCTVTDTSNTGNRISLYAACPLSADSPVSACK